MLVETADMLRVGAVNVLIMTLKKIDIDFGTCVFFFSVLCLCQNYGVICDPCYEKKKYHYHGIYDVLNQLTCNFSTYNLIKINYSVFGPFSCRCHYLLLKVSYGIMVGEFIVFAD